MSTPTRFLGIGVPYWIMMILVLRSAIRRVVYVVRW